MLVCEQLRHAAAVRPEHPAVVDDRGRLTYAQLAQRVRRLANALRDGLGLAAGERFGLLSGNRSEFAEIAFAAAAAGVVCVPINYRLTGREVAEILADAEARLLIAEPPYAASAEAFDGEVVWLGDGYEALLQAASDRPRGGPPPAADDVVLQIYTSGTTGMPKGVMLSHRNIAANCWHLLAERSATPEDRYLSTGPLCHMGAGSRLFLLVHAGATHVIHPRFDAERAVAALLDGTANAALIVPAMVRQLLDAAGGASLHGRVRQITYGTAPMPRELLAEALERLGCDFQQGYGLTEASPNLTILPPSDHHPDSDRLGTVGRETVGVHVRVVDADDRDVAPGEVGEVIARGENVMVGYWRRERETAEALRGGWLRTGDLGSFDAARYLTLVDRRKDMLVSGGFNVYPREVERQLEAHPRVAEVAVVGVPDDRWGEVPVAYVVPSAGAAADALATELSDFCAPRLARFKQPKHYRVVAELPRNAAGKVDKRALRGRDERSTP